MKAFHNPTHLVGGRRTNRANNRTRALRTLLVAGTALTVASHAPAFAEDIDTTPAWGVQSVSNWGAPISATYGQLITATTSQRLLSGFTFNLRHLYGEYPGFQAFVYEWDDANKRITGDALFTSSVMTAPDGSTYTPVAIDTGSVALTAGKQYVLFFTTSSVANSEPEDGYEFAAVDDATYEGGHFVYSNNKENFDNLLTVPWSSLGVDLSFIALLSGGETGFNATGMVQSSHQLMNGFLTTMLRPGMTSAGAQTNPLGYAANGSVLSEDAEKAYALALNDRDDTAQRFRVWGEAYGSYNTTDGGASAPDSQSRAYGLASGLDYALTDDTTVGFALGIGQTSWSSDAGAGSGDADVFQAGLYARHDFGSAYVAAAFAGSYNAVDTSRVAVLSTLAADYDAYSIGGRVEAGYRLVAMASTMTPYGALQVQNLHTPGYTETTTSGPTGQEVAYQSEDTLATRTELGIHIAHDFMLENGSSLSLFGRLGWAHDFDTDPGFNAAFTATPGSTFTVSGAERPSDLALITIGAGADLGGGWSTQAKFDGEFGDRSQTYAASGRISYAW